MKIYKSSQIKFDSDSVELSPEFLGWRGISSSEFDAIQKTGRIIPSQDLMPLDYEVVEYGIGDDIHEMSEEDIEGWVQSVCPWYDGSLSSIKGGVNVTTDRANAEGYGDVVVAIGGTSDYCDFSDSHRFVKETSKCRILYHYKP